MNYFSKYRYAIWTIIVLVIIILTAVISSVVYDHHKTMMPERVGHFHNLIKTLPAELGFTPEQTVKLNEIHQDFEKVAQSLSKQMEDKQILIVEELSKPAPDTVVLTKLADEMGGIYIQLKHQSIQHILQMRGICNPGQIEKFNRLTRKLIGPAGPGPGIKMEHRDPGDYRKRY